MHAYVRSLSKHITLPHVDYCPCPPLPRAEFEVNVQYSGKDAYLFKWADQPAVVVSRASVDMDKICAHVDSMFVTATTCIIGGDIHLFHKVRMQGRRHVFLFIHGQGFSYHLRLPHRTFPSHQDGHSVVSVPTPSYVASTACTSGSNAVVAPMNGKIEKVRSLGCVFVSV